ncbi:MAG TPA: single-stranded-DNA-specific exonuclease RecJ [Anaerolineae bacterium]
MATSKRSEWLISEQAPREFLAALSGIHPLVMQVLWARGYRDLKEVSAFLARDITRTDPFTLPDMAVAVERILRAIREGEKIAVYGDYDCDGVTSCALLMQVLRTLRANAQVYIPDRFDEGYGLNAAALDALHDQDVSLVITVDCGARANAEARHAREIGLGLIVTDHHALEDGHLPEALAVINPTRTDEANTYPFRWLAGVGVAYRLAQALLERYRDEDGLASPFDEGALLDLVAIGTVADVVPLVGENRALVQAGLERINTNPRIGVRYLAAAAGVKIGSVTAQTIGFGIGPRLNAAGRIKLAKDAFDILDTSDETEAAQLARGLNERNEQRQRATEGVTRSAELKTLGDGQTDAPLLFASSEDYSAGVIGLAASRLVEKFYKPAIVVATQMGEARGSCRSVDGFNITAALDECKDLLQRHGGHAMAAGFTTSAVQLEPLRERLIEIARRSQPDEGWTKQLRIDAIVNLHVTTDATLDNLNVLEPHGMGNMRPTFVARLATVQSIRRVGRTHQHGDEAAPPGPHLQLRLKDSKGALWQAVGFHMGDRADELRVGSKVDVVFQLEVNEYMGERRLQLRLVDIAPQDN